MKLNKIRIPKGKPAIITVALSILALLLLVLGQSTGEINSILGAFESSDPGWHRVLTVHDGDTIDVDILGKTETVRFIGVDTPETHHPSKPVQCFGQAASDFLFELLDGEQVSLEADPTNTNRDRYDRLLRYVYTKDSTRVNAEIIRQGYGFAYTSFPFQKLDEFRNLETEARKANKGLWGSCEIEEDGGYISTSPSSDNQ